MSWELVVWFAVAVVLATVLVTTLIVWLGEARVRAVTWKGGERWIRVTPNPGFRIAENVQWSKFYGRGRI